MSDKNETNHARRPVPTGVVCNAFGDLFAVAMMIADAVAADDEVACDIGRIIDAKTTPEDVNTLPE